MEFQYPDGFDRNAKRSSADNLSPAEFVAEIEQKSKINRPEEGKNEESKSFAKESMDSPFSSSKQKRRHSDVKSS